MTYNEIMQQPGKRINPKVFYYQNEEKVEISQDEIKLSKPFFNASLIGTIMKGLELELTSELPNVPIYFENIARYGTDSATKTIGPYYLKEKAEFNADSRTYTHKLYDNFVTTMVEYKPITITYPTTVLDFFQQLCTECGFTTNITVLPNGIRTIDHDIYDGINFTYRDVFDDIGQATGTLFKVTEANIEKCELGTSVVTINDDILKNQNISLGEHFGPINCIVLSRSADSDTIYKRDESLTEWNEFKISDNQLMNENNRDEFLDDLYNSLYGIEYDIFDLELVGYGGFEPLQKIEINTDNKTYDSYVFNNEESYTQGYTESIYTERPKESETDYTKSDKTDKMISQAYIIVDKQNKKISSLTNKVTENSEQLTQVTQTVSDFDISIKDVQHSLETTNGTIQTIEGKVIDMNFNFSTKGLNVGTSADANNSLLDNTGIKVYNYETLNAIFNNKGSGIEKLIVTGTAQIGYLKSVKSTKNNQPVTKIFHLKQLIEDLGDLE